MLGGSPFEENNDPHSAKNVCVCAVAGWGQLVNMFQASSSHCHDLDMDLEVLPPKRSFPVESVASRSPASPRTSRGRQCTATGHREQRAREPRRMGSAWCEPSKGVHLPLNTPKANRWVCLSRCPWAVLEAGKEETMILCAFPCMKTNWNVEDLFPDTLSSH